MIGAKPKKSVLWRSEGGDLETIYSDDESGSEEEKEPESHDVALLERATNRFEKLSIISGKDEKEIPVCDKLLWESIQDGSLEHVKLAVLKGARPWKESYDTSCLPICAAIENGYNDICLFLLSQVARLPERGFCEKYEQRHTLFDVVKYCKLETFKAFLNKGADHRIKDSSGNTVLHTAACCNHLEVARYLLSAEIKTPADVVNHKGETPLYQATEHNSLDVMRCLIDNGADVRKFITYGRLGYQGYSMTTALHIAAFCGYVPAAKLLINAGALVDQIDSYGQTALHDALSVGVSRESYPHHGTPEMIYFLLITADANQDIQDNFGKTAFDEADPKIIEKYTSYIKPLLRKLSK